MKILNNYLFLLFLSLFFIACNKGADDELVITDPVIDKASISVINVSKQASVPNQIAIDGLFNNNKSIFIGASAGQSATYQDIAAGIRKFSLGNYQDSITIKKHHYYTIMVFDKDSIQLSMDAPYDSEDQFVYMPLIRWNLIGDNPSDYKVDFMGDSLIYNIPVNVFKPFSATVGKVGLNLYHKNNEQVLLKRQDFVVDPNKKYTINISFDADSKQYFFNSIIQTVK